MAYDTYKCPDFPQTPSLPPNYTCVEVYTVKAGDTLYAISQAYGVPVAVLMQVNRILNPYNLKIGQKICIPGRQNDNNTGGGNTGGNTGGSNPNGKPPVCNNGRLHTIVKGDTLYMIAKKYNVPLAVIMRANANIDPYNLKVGQQLCIPNFPPEDQPSAPPTMPAPPVMPPTAPPSGEHPILPTPMLPSCGSNSRPYMTQRGDTLTRILERFDITYGQLMAANPDIDFEASLEGLTLCVPMRDGENADCGEMRSYTVQMGDSLDVISQKTGVLADHLLMANPDLTTSDFCKVGTTICIPR